MKTPLVGTAITARIVRRSNTTLYHLALEFLGDATQAPRIAKLNGFLDYWITAETAIRIPSKLKSAARPS